MLHSEVRSSSHSHNLEEVIMNEPQWAKAIFEKSGPAHIVEIWAAVTNTERQEGRGQSIDHSYYLTEEQATIGSVGIGVMGGEGKAEKRYAVEFGDGTIFLLAVEGFALPAEGAPVVNLIDIDVDKVTKERLDGARKRALSKLNASDRLVLGLKED